MRLEGPSGETKILRREDTIVIGRGFLGLPKVPSLHREHVVVAYDGGEQAGWMVARQGRRAAYILRGGEHFAIGSYWSALEVNAAAAGDPTVLLVCLLVDGSLLGFDGICTMWPNTDRSSRMVTQFACNGSILLFSLCWSGWKLPLTMKQM